MTLYYYHDGENEVGPFSADRLVKLARSGLLGVGTLVRAANNETWVPFGQLDLTDDAAPSLAAESGISLDGCIPPAPQTSGAAGLNKADASTLPPETTTDLKEAESGPKPGVSPSGWLALPPTPWRRYGARMLDTSLNGSIILLLLGVAFYAIAPASADEFFLFFEADGARVVDVVLTAIFASFLSGSLIGVSGFTLGKWIFGVKVTRLDGTKLGIGAGLSRDFTVLLKGLGLGIPVVALFTLWFSHKRLSENKSTSWDQGNYIVWHRPSGTSQYVLNFVGILLIVMVIGGLSALGGL